MRYSDNDYFSNVTRCVLCVSALLLLAAAGAPQVPEEERPLGVKIVDRARSGEPEKVPLENGRYKMVYRNKAHQIVWETIYEISGSLIQLQRKVQSTTISSAYPDGRPAEVIVSTFGEDDAIRPDPDDAGFPDTEEFIRYDAHGKRLDRIRYKATREGPINYQVREVTTWPRDAGPDGLTRRDKRDPATGKWLPFPESTLFAGKWYLETNGTRQPGDHKFVESPALVELYRGKELWLLIFNPAAEIKGCWLPGESKDHLGFGRRLIQLRGDPKIGKLEFWMTVDERTSDYRKTNYVLVRESK